MPGNIKGITIEFRGDTTNLDKAIRSINNETKALDKELKDVNRALKFNPKNVDLWRQKQQLLNEKVEATEKQLKELKDAQEQMDAKGVDKSSAEYRKLQREIIQTESKLKHFKGQLNSIGNVKLKAVSLQLKEIGDTAMKAGKSLTTKLSAPLAAIGGIAVSKFAEVDKTMQLVNMTMSNTEEEADMLSDAMKSAAAQSTYGMDEAATAMLNFARAGLDATEAADALAPAMALAAGEGGELDTVSGGLVATINGFGDSFENTAQYADVFANACNNTALDVNSLSEAMSVAAPIFSAAGYNVQDAALYMGIMANNGIEAGKAANSLKTGMARLISPAKEGAEWMDRLGIEMTNADGTMKDTVQIQQELHDAFAQLSESEQIAAASAIFGKNQMAPWLALINTAPDEVDKLNQSLGETGTALEMQAGMMKGFGGSLEQLKSGIDVLMTSLGEALAPVIQQVVDLIQQLVDWFNSLDSDTQTMIATIGMVVAAIGPLLMIFGALSSAIGSIIAILPMIGTAFTAMTGPIGLAVIAIGAAVAVGVKLYKNWDKIKAKAKELAQHVKAKFQEMRNKVSAIVQSMRESVANKWQAMKDRVASITDGVKTKIAGAWDSIKTKTADTWESIKSKVTEKFDAVKEKIDSVVSWLKGLFPINIGNIFSNVKLPHFDWHWENVGETKLKIPKFDGINWYAKGGIFDDPTVFGDIGIGEKGPEAVLPLDPLWERLDRIEEKPAETNITFNITVNGAEDPEMWARKLVRMMNLEMRAT